MKTNLIGGPCDGQEITIIGNLDRCQPEIWIPAGFGFAWIYKKIPGPKWRYAGYKNVERP